MGQGYARRAATASAQRAICRFLSKLQGQGPRSLSLGSLGDIPSKRAAACSLRNSARYTFA
jgi:hypothetical protein